MSFRRQPLARHFVLHQLRHHLLPGDQIHHRIKRHIDQQLADRPAQPRDLIESHHRRSQQCPLHSHRSTCRQRHVAVRHGVPGLALYRPDRTTLKRLSEECRPARRRRRQDETEILLPAQNLRRAHQFRQMPKGLTATTAGEHCYQWTTLGQVVFPEKLRARERRPHARCRRMSDICRGHVVFSEKRFFKGKYAQQAVDDPAHGFDTSLAPGPDLRRDKIDHRHAQPLELRRHAEMEIRGIGEDREVRHALCRFPDQPPISEPDPRQVAHHLHYSDYGQILRSDDSLHPRLAQVRSGAAEKSAVRPAAAQFEDQFRGVEIAGGFSGGYQNLRGAGFQPAAGLLPGVWTLSATSRLARLVTIILPPLLLITLLLTHAAI